MLDNRVLRPRNLCESFRRLLRASLRGIDHLTAGSDRVAIMPAHAPADASARSFKVSAESHDQRMIRIFTRITLLHD
jgi:hypothetical protein